MRTSLQKSHDLAPSTTSRGARVIKIPPPLYFVAAFLAGRGINRLVPWTVDDGVSGWVGIALLVAGVAFVLGGVIGVAVHRTTIVPHRPVSTLVRTGAYRLSRNPMYTGLAVAYTGLALVTGSWWPLVTLPIAVVAIRRLVIAPEEAYLAGAFPVEFADYRSRVRRWL